MNMPELAAGGVSLFTVWLLGLSLGLTACAVTCLPFVGTWALGRAGGRREALLDTAAFLGGRLLAYSLLGALAGALGAWFVSELAAGWGHLAIGLSSLAAALVLLWPRRSTPGTCAPLRRRAALSPLLLGIALTLIPCAPLATLLAACAAGGSAGEGASLGLAFGLGTVLTPLLVLMPASASLGRKLLAENRWLAPWLRGGAAAVLLLLAGRRLLLVLPPAALSAVLVLTALLWLLGWQRRPKQEGHRIVIHRAS